MNDARIRENLQWQQFMWRCCVDVEWQFVLWSGWHVASWASHTPAVGGRIGIGSDDHDENNEEDEREEWSDEALGRRVEGDARDYISEVREGSLWASLCDCLSPKDVVVLRTAGSKWYDAELYGEFAQLWLVRKFLRFISVQTKNPMFYVLQPFIFRRWSKNLTSFSSVLCSVNDFRFLAELWFFLMKTKGTDVSHLSLCQNGPIDGTLPSGCSNQDDHQTWPPSQTQESGPERTEEKWRCVVPWNSTYNHIIDAGVSMSSGHDVKLLALSALGGCQHVHYTPTVIVVRAHASWTSWSIWWVLHRSF